MLFRRLSEIKQSRGTVHEGHGHDEVTTLRVDGIVLVVIVVEAAIVTVVVWNRRLEQRTLRIER